MSAVCIGLTILSFVLNHGSGFDPEATMRAVVGLIAIAMTTLLSLHNREAARSVKAQADLLDLTRDAIFVRDDAGVIRYWNLAAEQLYGWSAAEAEGREASTLLQSRFPAATVEVRAELERHGRWEGEIGRSRRDGTKLTVMSRWSLQRDARGRPVATMVTDTDITERRSAEDALRRAEAELAHATRVTTMGELTASIAHEVNQPLAAVVTNGEACLRWLGRPLPDLGEARASVGRMIADGHRAGDVVARLRSLARRSDPAHRPLDLNETIEDATLLLEREALSRSVVLDLRLAPDLPPVAGDRVQLQQVVINLALNAIQAMEAIPEGDRYLTIGTERAGTAEEPAALIRVVDTGPGVAAEVLPRLFEAFYSTKEDGMDMGLSISRSIVQAHGGRIEATRGESCGMYFTLTLPLHEEPPP